MEWRWPIPIGMGWARLGTLSTRVVVEGVLVGERGGLILAARHFPLARSFPG